MNTDVHENKPALINKFYEMKIKTLCVVKNLSLFQIDGPLVVCSGPRAGPLVAPSAGIIKLLVECESKNRTDRIVKEKNS